MNSQGDNATQNENEKSPENKFKDIEIFNLNDRIHDCTSGGKIKNKNSM